MPSGSLPARPSAAFAVAGRSGVSYLEPEAFARADAVRREKCVMDWRFPQGRPGFATIVWLHGGGLVEGGRRVPVLGDPGIGVIGAGYRLATEAAHPAYLEDAAAVAAWALKNVAGHGGDPAKVFLAGHSAGGWLAAVAGMDPRWLAAHGLSNRALAGIIPVSAQMTTHFHVRKLRGDLGPELRPVIDELAPLHHVSPDLPPVCLIVGDRKAEFPGRVEENRLLAAALRNLGHPLVECHEMGGLDHGAVRDGSWLLLPGFAARALTWRRKPS